jgi:hypothetical protein
MATIIYARNSRARARVRERVDVEYKEVAAFTTRDSARSRIPPAI